MLRNYFTLYHSARELHEQLAGGYVFEIHSQEKNEITLSFITNDGRHLQIIVVTKSPKFSFYTREGLNRKKRNAASLMTGLCEKEVKSVSISPVDREILFSLEGAEHLVLRLYTAETNLFLVENGRIIDAFKDRTALNGREYVFPEERSGILRQLESIANCGELFMERFRNTDSAISLQERILSVLQGFDRSLVREVCSRAQGSEIPEMLYKAFSEVFYELLDPSPCVVSNAGNPPEFTILERCPDGGVRFERVIDALNHYTFSMRRFLHVHEKIRAIRTHIEQQIRKIRNELSGFSPDELAATAARSETRGHLLIANIYSQPQSSGSLTVRNIFEPDSPEITIPLKPGLNIRQNAESFFEKAAKSRGRLKAMEERHAVLMKTMEELTAILEAAGSVTTTDELKHFQEKIAGKVNIPGLAPRTANRKQSPFRTVELTPGITLYIGRNAKNNELLTFEHTRPDDIWLHARGTSGSHCVLKGAGLQNTSEIQRAAEIAAWYSQAKHSELVPVIYTQKKYVRRGKKTAPGSVIVEREKVILVRPLKD